jgi:hypothetical protein
LAQPFAQRLRAGDRLPAPVSRWRPPGVRATLPAPEVPMLKKIGLALIAVILILAIVIATRPAAYRVSRSEVIQAPPSVVYAQVADFHRWKAWSPWEKLDPNMQTAYSGTDGVPGATYAWKGNDSVGEGRMTLVDARPGQLVGLKLEFLKPFSSVCTTRFDFAPQGPATRLAWTMEGTNDFAGKAFSLVMNMDKMVGGDFERGLSQLKTVSEGEAAKASAGSAAR